MITKETHTGYSVTPDQAATSVAEADAELLKTGIPLETGSSSESLSMLKSQSSEQKETSSSSSRCRCFKSAVGVKVVVVVLCVQMNR